jgi:hypothetical protein
MHNGIILYEGPSLLNGEPIVVILTGLRAPSANSKTGPMAQVWVLPQEIPSAAIKEKRDSSVCGDCPLKGGICYVNPITLNNVYRAWVKKLYGSTKKDIAQAIKHIKLHRCKVRLTAYGEAPAAPYEVFEPFLKSYTGYTHQWKNPSIDQRWKGKLQASVHSLPEAEEAWAAGWSTFRITLPHEKPTENETLCLYMSKGLQCSSCGLCNGKKNITDPIHGLAHKQATFKTMRTSYKPAPKSRYLKANHRFFHGTSADFFNEPKAPFWLTTSEEKAQRFSVLHENGYEPRVLAYRLKRGRIFVYDTESALEYLFGKENIKLLASLCQSERNRKIAELVMRDLAYDGVLFVNDSGKDEHSLVVLNPTIIEAAKMPKLKIDH